MERELARLSVHRCVGEVRQKGVMVGIELVEDSKNGRPFPAEQRRGHSVTLAARRRGSIVRPLGDVVVVMPAPAMPGELVERLCRTVVEAIEETTGR